MDTIASAAPQTRNKIRTSIDLQNLEEEKVILPIALICYQGHGCLGLYYQAWKNIPPKANSIINWNPTKTAALLAQLKIH